MATILLTIEQVASRMQISRTSVYRLIAAGQLDVVKIMGSTPAPPPPRARGH